MIFFDFNKHKVEFRFIGILLLFSLVFFSIGGLYIYQKSSRQVEEKGIQDLNTINKRVVTRINTIISDKERIGSLLNNLVRQRINEFETESTIDDYSREYDNSIRILADPPWTGAFVPSRAILDNNLINFIEATEQMHREVLPFVKLSFLNIWYTSSNSAFRLSPPGSWIIEVESDYDGPDYPFYSLADEKQNPERKLVWTPLCYDERLESWVTSLIIPDYREDLLLGVSGNDYDLKKLFDEFIVLSEENNEITTFLFDSDFNIIVHPQYLNEIYNTWKVTNSLLSSKETPDQWAYTLLSHYYQNGYDSLFSEHIKIAGEDYLAVASPVGFLDWQIGSYKTNRDIQVHRDQLFFQILSGIFIFTIIIIFLISLWVRKLILSRLFNIKTFAEEFSPNQKQNHLTVRSLS